MSVRFGTEIGFIFHRITAQSENIIDFQKIQIDQKVFGFLPRKPSAQDMWYGIHLVFILYCRTNSYCTRSFFDHLFSPQTFSIVFVLIFFPVICYIDEFWIKPEKGFDIVKYRLNVMPFQWGKISNEKRVSPFAFSICSVTFNLVYLIVLNDKIITAH